MATEAYVSKLPLCDFHKEQGVEQDAQYDAKTVLGPWASMCSHHFLTMAASKTLGTGMGQKYVVGEPPARDRHAEAKAALDANDFEAFEDAVGDGDPIDFL